MAKRYYRYGPTPDDIYLRYEQQQAKAVRVLLALAFQGAGRYRVPPMRRRDG